MLIYKAKFHGKFKNHIYRNKIIYIVGSIVIVTSLGWFLYSKFCSKKRNSEMKQEVREGVFSYLSDTDSNLVGLLQNQNIKGNRLKIKNILSEFFDLNGNKLIGKPNSKAVDLINKLKNLKNNKIQCSWFNSIENKTQKADILSSLKNIHAQSKFEKMTT